MEQKVEFSAFELFFGDKALKGSMYGSANVRVDMPKLLRLWKAGKLDLEGMITRRIDLGEINEAFAAMLNGEVIRSVIEVPSPVNWAMTCSIGPPGASCTTTKLITMMPSRVGIMSRRRRAM